MDTPIKICIFPGSSDAIVLREWLPGVFATHYFNSRDRAYYHGHYFEDMEQAVSDYHARVERFQLSNNLNSVSLTEVFGKL